MLSGLPTERAKLEGITTGDDGGGGGSRRLGYGSSGPLGTYRGGIGGARYRIFLNWVGGETLDDETLGSGTLDGETLDGETLGGGTEGGTDGTLETGMLSPQPLFRTRGGRGDEGGDGAVLLQLVRAALAAAKLG